ncbi:MAG: hypothetical protein ABUS49_00320 [Acidobacteriota bacterium]
MLFNPQIRRNGRLSAFLRVCIVLVAIVAMLGVATSATSSAHLHPKAPAGGCDICLAAHVASLEAKAVTTILQTPRVFGRITASATVPGYRLLYRSSFLTRGPPSFSL